MAITGIDTIEGKQIIAAGAVSAKSAEMAYKDENGNPITGYQVAGDYLTTADSANFYTTANESGFITGVDLTPYQTTAGMTAYQPVGDYLTTADSANFYTTANESGYLTAVPDTYLQNTDLSTEDGKVTAISGIPLSAGGDVPEGVMVESGLEYNAVNEISGYNGSAIAQYGAEKQWLVHDDTLVHAANSAQYALGVNLSAVAQLLGLDRTLLWSGSKGSVSDTMDLSEPISSFNKVEFIMNEGNTAIPLHSFIGNTDGTILYPYCIRTNSNNAELCYLWSLNRQNNDTRLSVAISVTRTNGGTTGANATKFNEIWGIGRKQ